MITITLGQRQLRGANSNTSRLFAVLNTICFIFALGSLAFAGSSFATDGDPRCVSISELEIERDDANPQLSAEQQIIVLTRCYNFRLSYEAAEVYSKAADQSPQNPMSQLLAGIACGRAFLFAIKYQVQFPSPAPSQDYQSREFSYLSKAYKLAPSSPVVDSFYGYYLCTEDVNEDLGASLVRKAAALDRGPSVQMNLALLYSNPYFKQCDLPAAKKLLTKLILVDPHWAFAHRVLGSVYDLLGDTRNASLNNAVAAKLWEPILK